MIVCIVSLICFTDFSHSNISVSFLPRFSIFLLSFSFIMLNKYIYTHDDYFVQYDNFLVCHCLFSWGSGLISLLHSPFCLYTLQFRHKGIKLDLIWRLLLRSNFHSTRKRCASCQGRRVTDSLPSGEAFHQNSNEHRRHSQSTNSDGYLVGEHQCQAGPNAHSIRGNSCLAL